MDKVDVSRAHFNFFAQKSVYVQLTNYKVYKMRIKNAEKVKEEIEKRILNSSKIIK
jgi:hypothetical protein